MIAAEHPDELWKKAEDLAVRGCTGLLVSGGCDLDGRVPLAPFLSTIRRIHDSLRMRVVAHVGLVDANAAKELAQSGVDRVMLDLVGDRDTAREVIHLDAAPERFATSLQALIEAGLAAVPHVVVGLHFGQLRGEMAAIEMAARFPIKALVLVVVRPQPGSAMDRIKPPTPEKVARLMGLASLALPATPVMLGCARPVGIYARILERYALEAGLNGIAFPSDESVDLAQRMGFQTVFSEHCCSLLHIL